MEACTGRYFTGNPPPKRAEMTGNTNLIASLRHDKSQISCRIIRDRERVEKNGERDHCLAHDAKGSSIRGRGGGLPSALSLPSDRGRDVPSFFSAGSGQGWDKPLERCLGFTDAVLRRTLPPPCQNGSLKTPSKSTTSWYWKTWLAHSNNTRASMQIQRGKLLEKRVDETELAAGTQRGWECQSDSFFSRATLGGHACTCLNIYIYWLCVHVCVRHEQRYQTIKQSWGGSI